jgi:hypothetical protein
VQADLKKEEQQELIKPTILAENTKNVETQNLQIAKK